MPGTGIGEVARTTMQYDNPLTWARWSAAGLICVSSAVSAQPWAGGQRGGGPLPTRMVLCQHEFGPNAAAERNAQLRACLARRLEGERVVERDCKRQTAGVTGAQSRRLAMRDCEQMALNVPSSELPRRAPPPLRLRPAPQAPLLADTASTTP